MRSAATTLALGLGLVSALLASCDGKPAAPSFSEPVAFKLAVKGMHCEGCEGAIVDKVTKVEGVTACKASHTAEEVEVVAPAEQREAIAAAIRKLGYKLGE
jgi:copper chaperone CopZ